MGRRRLERRFAVINGGTGTDVASPLLLSPTFEPPDTVQHRSTSAEPPDVAQDGQWELELAEASAHLASAHEIIAKLSSQRSAPFGVLVADELEYAATGAFSALAVVDHCSQTLWLRQA
jgi:hypothetical protein